MKKQFVGILLIAVLAIVGGMKFFGNANVTSASGYCDVFNNIQGGSGLNPDCDLSLHPGSGGAYCNQGMCGPNPVGMYPGSTSGAGFSASSFYTNLYSGVAWVTENGTPTTPLQVTPRLVYHDAVTGEQIFLVGADSQKVAGLVNNLVTGRIVNNDGGQLGKAVNTCGTNYGDHNASGQTCCFDSAHPSYGSFYTTYTGTSAQCNGLITAGGATSSSIVTQ